MTGLVRAHFKLLQKERPPFSQLQEVLSVILAWWVVPFTLYGVWARYIPRHDWIGTGIHLALIAGVLGFAVVSHRFAVETLRGEKLAQLSPWLTLKTATSRTSRGRETRKTALLRLRPPHGEQRVNWGRS